MKQIAQHTRRERILESIHSREQLLLREKERRVRIAQKENLPGSSLSSPKSSPRHKHGRSSKKEILIRRKPLSPNTHHQLSDSQRDRFNLLEFVRDHKNDPAVKVDIEILLMYIADIYST
jgi:hypothetical protein